MNTIRRMIMIGTIAFVISTSTGMWNNNASASLLGSIDELDAQRMQFPDLDNNEDALHEILGLESDEELRNATYTYQSLAKIADIQNVDVERIITLQSTQLLEQLDERLARGHLTLHEYGTLTAEIPDIIRKSVYGETG